MKRVLQSHEKYMCTLNEDQTAEMNDIMSKIGDNFNGELNSLFQETSQSGILWEHDKPFQCHNTQDSTGHFFKK